QRPAWTAGAVRAVDADDARPRGLGPLRGDEGVPRATIGHEPTDGERARLGARTGRNSQHAGPEGDPRGSKSVEGSGLRVLRHHSNDLRSSRYIRTMHRGSIRHAIPLGPYDF